MFEFLLKTPCSHGKINAGMKSGYCPDCGEYVENHWFITRCECCGVKQKSLIKNGKVVSDAKFCKNCGHSSFEVEELQQLDIVNIHYAVVQKSVRKIKKESFIQAWIDKNNYSPMKLLPSC